jgi:hypothetical protein
MSLTRNGMKMLRRNEFRGPTHPKRESPDNGTPGCMSVNDLYPVVSYVLTNLLLQFASTRRLREINDTNISLIKRMAGIDASQSTDMPFKSIRIKHLNLVPHNTTDARLSNFIHQVQNSNLRNRPFLGIRGSIGMACSEVILGFNIGNTHFNTLRASLSKLRIPSVPCKC